MEYIVHIKRSVQMITSLSIWFPFHGVVVQIMGSCRMSFEIEQFIYTIYPTVKHMNQQRTDILTTTKQS